jgi:hypothetical protein
MVVTRALQAGPGARDADAAAVITRLCLLAAVVTGFCVLAAVVTGFCVLAAVVTGFCVLAAVVTGFCVPAEVVDGPGACGNMDRDALRERCIADQPGNSGGGSDDGRRSEEEQSFHGFFLPWVRLLVVNHEPRLGPPLAIRPTTRASPLMTRRPPHACGRGASLGPRKKRRSWRHSTVR